MTIPSHGNSTMASSTFATWIYFVIGESLKSAFSLFQTSNRPNHGWEPSIPQKHDGHHMKDGFLAMSHVSFPKAPILTGTLRENQALVVGMLQRIFQLLQATSEKSERLLTWWRIKLKPGKTEANSSLQVLTSSVCKSAELMSLLVSSNLSPGKSWTDSLHNLQESMVSSRPFNVWEMCWQRWFKGHSKSPTSLKVPSPFDFQPFPSLHQPAWGNQDTVVGGRDNLILPLHKSFQRVHLLPGHVAWESKRSGCWKMKQKKVMSVHSSQFTRLWNCKKYPASTGSVSI